MGRFQSFSDCHLRPVSDQFQIVVDRFRTVLFFFRSHHQHDLVCVVFVAIAVVVAVVLANVIAHKVVAVDVVIAAFSMLQELTLRCH